MTRVIRCDVGGKVELTRAGTALAELKPELAAPIKGEDSVRLRIDHEQRIAGNGQAGGSLQRVSNGKDRAVVFVEGKDFPKFRVGHVESSVPFEDSDRRGKSRFLNARPTTPLFMSKITIQDRVVSGI